VSGETRSGEGDRVLVSRMPTMSDIAAHVGVSRQLVSMILRDRPGPSEESRERVIEAAAELGYRVNESARLLRRKKTGLIGAFYSMRHPFESFVVERMLEIAPQRDYRLVLGPVTDWRTTDEAIGELLQQRVEAVVGFATPGWEEVVIETRTVAPIVLMGGPTPGVDNVHIDDLEGMRAAVEHLVDLGHARIAHLRGGSDTAGETRARAYDAAMRERGLIPEVLSEGWTEEDGARAGHTIMDMPSPPTAVICSSDIVASGLLAELARAGVPVPQSLSVVGWDDSYVASLSYHSLTSVRQEVGLTAEVGLELAVRRLTVPDADVREVRTPATLIVRMTTARPSG
jgi:DNA-binding LacI/PurR family transcriptional regulator